MEIKPIVVGNLETNCYIITKDNNQIIIDPGDQFNLIDEHLTNPKFVIITHYHQDHIKALNELTKKYNIPVLDYNNEGKNTLDTIKVEITKVPGHHDTCIMIKIDDNLFTGDFLFKGTIGRTDLETGNMSQMKESLKLLNNLPNLKVYPGHGPSTTLDYERYTNKYLN